MGAQDNWSRLTEELFLGAQLGDQLSDRHNKLWRVIETVPQDGDCRGGLKVEMAYIPAIQAEILILNDGSVTKAEVSGFADIPEFTDPNTGGIAGEILLRQAVGTA